MKTYFSFCRTELGEVLLTSNGCALTGVYLDKQKYAPIVQEEEWVRNDKLEIFRDAAKQLDEYFAGRRTEFDLEFEFTGTEFQNDVWKQLTKIPYGETISYGELAHRIGRPKAVRAVGQANGRNPISIMVPCHRVIGTNGTLTGYGGGLPRKEYLLQHEQRKPVASKR